MDEADKMNSIRAFDFDLGMKVIEVSLFFISNLLRTLCFPSRHPWHVIDPCVAGAP